MKKLTTLTGPSCAGKSTLEAMMVERGCAKAVSVTTRAPRAGEVDGVDYYFVSNDKFNTLKVCNMFVEFVQFGDQQYGLTTTELKRLYMSCDHVVVVCEPIGAAQIKRWARSEQGGILLTSVFVDNPSSVIAERFLRRVIADATSTATLQTSEKIIKSYSKRMAMMIDAEPLWRNPSSSGLTYDLTLPTFDETNCSDIANLLCGAPAIIE